MYLSLFMGNRNLSELTEARFKCETHIDFLMEIVVVLEPQEEGGFTAYVPSLPGCISEGDTREEAILNIKEAIVLYLEPDTKELTKSSGEKIRVDV
jgi:predicted RNase H-like HicB family nuclease